MSVFLNIITDRHTSQSGVALWIAFQNAASAVTNMYKGRIFTTYKAFSRVTTQSLECSGGKMKYEMSIIWDLHNSRIWSITSGYTFNVQAVPKIVSNLGMANVTFWNLYIQSK